LVRSGYLQPYNYKNTPTTHIDLYTVFDNRIQHPICMPAVSSVGVCVMLMMSSRSRVDVRQSTAAECRQDGVNFVFIISSPTSNAGRSSFSFSRPSHDNASPRFSHLYVDFDVSMRVSRVAKTVHRAVSPFYAEFAASVVSVTRGRYTELRSLVVSSVLTRLEYAAAQLLRQLLDRTQPL